MEHIQVNSEHSSFPEWLMQGIVWLQLESVNGELLRVIIAGTEKYNWQKSYYFLWIRLLTKTTQN